MAKLAVGPKTNRKYYLKNYLFKFFADESECLVNGISVTSYSDNAFRARTITYVDLGTTLKSKQKKNSIWNQNNNIFWKSFFPYEWKK